MTNLKSNRVPQGATGFSEDHSNEMRVLLVEDSIAEQTRLAAVLNKQGYAVVTARDGAAALSILKERAIDIVISDWEMPRLGGIELCKAIRKEPSYGQPYFIIVTGHGMTCNLVACMDAGADDFITKPFNSEEMRVRVQAGKRNIELRRFNSSSDR